MKTLTLTLALLFTLVRPSGSWGNMSAPDCSTCTVANNSSFIPGTVTIGDGSGDETTLNVNGFGNFSTTICYTATWVEINGQRVNYPNTQDVQLPSGEYIRVSWPSTGWVQLEDKTLNNSPIR